MFSSAVLVVLFIVLPHTHSKANSRLIIGRRQVPLLPEPIHFAKSLKIVEGHWKWHHSIDRM